MLQLFRDKKVILIFVLIAIGIAYRLMDHSPNFSPIAAIALFGGFYFKKFRMALIPIFIMLVTDFIIGFYAIGIMASVYLSYLIISLMGVYISKYKSFLTILATSISGSVLFYITTNFSVWFFGRWYEHTMEGLAQSYINALPFFRNTLIGDLFFTILIFGTYKISIFILQNKKFAQKNILKKIREGYTVGKGL